MNFVLSEEQEELRSSVRRFLEDKSPSLVVRRWMESELGVDLATYTQLTSQLGLSSLAIPEAYGGAGFGFVELAVVLEELGRSLACVPYFSTVVLGAYSILLSQDEAAKVEHLAHIASGERRFALAIYEEDGDFDYQHCETRALWVGDSYRLTGSKSYVIDGDSATHLVVLARSETGLSLFTIPVDSPGLATSSLSTLDLTRRLANLDLNQVRAELLGAEGEAAEVVERILDIAVTALSLEMIGGSQRCLEMAVAYAKSRFQFGRAIGGFQAIKHKCADMLVEVEAAKSAAYAAAWSVGQDLEELRILAPMAKAFCADAYFLVASENIQIHGGIGFTWENDAHLYFKRAKASQILFGDSVYFRRVLADRLGL